MIKCEMHLHIYGASGCAAETPENIAKIYYKAGYGAITVTNHYMKYIFENYYPSRLNTDRERIKYYVSFYKELKKCCKPYGIKVFLGMELNPECMNTAEVTPAAEFLCYGVTEKFLYDYPCLYDYTQKELFEIFNSNKILMFQAHPFRGYCIRGDFRYMHGLEVYNGNHQNNNQMAEAAAKQNNLLAVSGSDFHVNLENSVSGGILIPENINNSVQLAMYIKNNRIELIKGQQ